MPELSHFAELSVTIRAVLEAKNFIADWHAIIDDSPVSRSSTFRVLAGILLVLLGWQLGAAHEQGRSAGVRVGGGEETGLLRPGESSSGVTVHNPQRDVDISLLWEVWEQLNDHYIEPEKLQVSPLVYGAAEGLTRAAGDPYTAFMTPKQNREFRDGLSGNLEGIGAELTVKDGVVTVVTPIKGSPAERAGLKSKDVIANVNGESTEGWSLSQTVEHIRGPKGTTVTLTVFREKSGEVELTITRDQIHIPSAELTMVERGKKKIAVLALHQFGEQSVAEFKAILQEALEKDANGLIIDLRNNGGGYLDGAIDITSLFVSKGTVVTVARRKGVEESIVVRGRTIAPDLPVVILQNEATASASEIVSGALQDHGRAKVVGTKSFGKGTVQEVIDLDGGASMRITVARWLTPNGKDLSKEGVSPDILVASGSGATMGEPGKDAQLDRAIDLLVSGG